jgi:hypothetical protein
VYPARRGGKVSKCRVISRPKAMDANKAREAPAT